MVQEKVNTACQFSVRNLSHARSDELLEHLFATLLLFCFQPRTLVYKNQNRLSLRPGKSSILWNSVAAGGGESHISSERSIMFPRTEITSICLRWY